ncbi:MAG: hypothetical protein U0746_21550 [Gemmataceae bacterium]
MRSGRANFRFTSIEHNDGHDETVEIVGDATFDGVRRTYHQRQEIVRFEPAPPDEMDKTQKRLSALKGNADSLIREGLAKRVMYDIASAFDGERYCNRLTGSAAVYKSIDKNTDFIVDPRTWGVTTAYIVNDDLTFFFPSDTPIRLLGRDRVGDHDVWTIEIDKGNRFSRFWIADHEPFRVYKYEVARKGGNSATTAVSGFAGAADNCPLPTQVDVEIKRDGRVKSAESLFVSNLAINVPVDPAVGKIESLNLPAGVPVQDHMAHKTIGIWDGKSITPATPERRLAAQEQLRSEVAAQDAAAVMPPRPWTAYIFPVLAVLACFGLVGWYAIRRQRSRGRP